MGEVGDAQRGLELLGAYTSGPDMVHMCYAFEFLAKSKLDAARVAEVFAELARVGAEGWPCWAFSNHDVVRHASRWELGPQALRLFATLILCMRGSVCLYQGEELGFGEADVPFEDLQDPYGIAFWPEFKGRDGCRTPMVWDQSNQNGGFSGGMPWLPVSHEHMHSSVAAQEAEPGAILHHYRKAIAFRKAHRALTKGAHESISVTGDVLHFIRTHPTETLFCAFNMSDTPSHGALPPGRWQTIGYELGSATPYQEGNLHFGPWQVCLALKLD